MSGNGKTLLRPSLLKPTTVFDDFFKPWNQFFDDRWVSINQLPSVNIKETDDEYEIKMAAPGLEKNDFKIDVNGTMITISAEKDEKKEEKEEDYTRKEYSYTSFSRSFSLPDNIDASKIDASYVHGELKLLLPKKEETKKSTHKTIAVH
jgi:HSP20 family protein